MPAPAFTVHAAAGRTDEFPTAERCHIVEHLNDPRLPAYSLARARVEPGVATELHALPVRELYILLAGEGRMEDGTGRAVTVRAGDCVDIPPGAPQRIVNTGAGDLVFLCLCLPRFEPEGYAALEP